MSAVPATRAEKKLETLIADRRRGGISVALVLDGDQRPGPRKQQASSTGEFRRLGISTEIRGRPKERIRRRNAADGAGSTRRSTTAKGWNFGDRRRVQGVSSREGHVDDASERGGFPTTTAWRSRGRSLEAGRSCRISTNRIVDGGFYRRRTPRLVPEGRQAEKGRGLVRRDAPKPGRKAGARVLGP